MRRLAPLSDALAWRPTPTSSITALSIKRVKAEKETLGEIARSYNVSRWTISRLEP